MALGDAIFQIQSAVAKVEKDGTNPHTKSGYPTIEGVLDVLNPQLQEHKVTVKQFTAFIEGQWVLRTSVSHVSEVDFFDLPLLGIQGSKNEMQAIGSAITYARRYALMAYFKLAPTDDDGSGTMKIVSEKVSPSTEKKSAKPPAQASDKSKDMKIPDGKFKGKMVSTVPREELAAYVEDILQAMETSGRKPPKWFDELRKVSGL
jgi:hypothetical protein